MAHPCGIVRGACGNRIQFQSVGSATNLLRQDLGLGYSQIGMLLGAYLLPGVIVALPAGLLGQRVREKTLGLAGLVLMVVSGVALSHSGDLAVALVARTIGGVGATIVILVATKMVVDWFDDPRDRACDVAVANELAVRRDDRAADPEPGSGNRWVWPAVMASGAVCAVAVLCPFALLPQPSGQLQAAADRPRKTARCRADARDRRRHDLGCDESRLHSVLQLRAIADGGAGIVGDGFGLADQSCDLVHDLSRSRRADISVHRWGKPIVAIIACGLIAALALMLFVADFHPTISCLVFGLAIGPLSGAILSLPANVLEPGDRSLGFGLFYTCFYVLVAVGPSVAGLPAGCLGIAGGGAHRECRFAGDDGAAGALFCVAVEAQSFVQAEAEAARRVVS